MHMLQKAAGNILDYLNATLHSIHLFINNVSISNHLGKRRMQA